MSLLEKAQHCITMSQELLYEGEHARSLECALEAAKYLQLIRLLRQEVTPARRDSLSLAEVQQEGQ